MVHPLEELATACDFFRVQRLIPAAAIGVIIGAIIGVAAGILWWSASLGIVSGLVSAVGAGALFDFWVWQW